MQVTSIHICDDEISLIKHMLDYYGIDKLSFQLLRTVGHIIGSFELIGYLLQEVVVSSERDADIFQFVWIICL